MIFVRTPFNTSNMMEVLQCLLWSTGMKPLVLPVILLQVSKHIGLFTALLKFVQVLMSTIHVHVPHKPPLGWSRPNPLLPFGVFVPRGALAPLLTHFLKMHPGNH